MSIDAHCSFDSIECDLGECLRRSCRHLCCRYRVTTFHHRMKFFFSKTRQSRFRACREHGLAWCIGIGAAAAADRHFTCALQIQFVKYEVYSCKCAAPISVMIHEPRMSIGRVSIIAENHYAIIWPPPEYIWLACSWNLFVQITDARSFSVSTINIYSLLIHGGCWRNVCLPANCTHHNHCAKRIK